VLQTFFIITINKKLGSEKKKSDRIKDKEIPQEQVD
jgi:hypothetical protein